MKKCVIFERMRLLMIHNIVPEIDIFDIVL